MCHSHRRLEVSKRIASAFSPWHNDALYRWNLPSTHSWRRCHTHDRRDVADLLVACSLHCDAHTSLPAGTLFTILAIVTASPSIRRRTGYADHRLHALKSLFTVHTLWCIQTSPFDIVLRARWEISWTGMWSKLALTKLISLGLKSSQSYIRSKHDFSSISFLGDGMLNGDV